MEAIGQLAGGVAHDFNNLLTVINGYARLLELHTPPEDSRRSKIEEIHRAGERAANLTRQLLAFGRKQVFQTRVVQLGDVLRGMEEMLRRLIGEDIRLAWTLGREVPQVKADPGQVEQVIMNLVVNARDAMPGGGTISIEVSSAELDESYAAAHAEVRPGAYALVAVSDTGTGIPADIQSHIFEPFFTTKEVGKGTGLGLATVYGIVKQSGGHVSFYTEDGMGTTSKVYLPAATEVPRTERGAESGAVARAGGAETILLVEDEDGVRGLVRQVLKRKGYSVLEARDGGEALLTCEHFHEPIHLLLTDVVLAHMSGRELAERLGPQRPEMRVLYMSGYTDDAIVQHGVLAQETAFLQKPFTTDALARKVRDVLDGGNAPRG